MNHEEFREKKIKTELYHDNFQSYKRYGIPKAQLVIADIPYNLAGNAYASNPEWYVGGDNKNGESGKAKKSFFNGDGEFNLNEYFHFCGKPRELREFLSHLPRVGQRRIYEEMSFLRAFLFLRL